MTDVRKCACFNVVTSLKHRREICSEICCSHRNKSTIFLNLTSECSSESDQTITIANSVPSSNDDKVSFEPVIVD
jgi:hypothetical protein